MAELYGDVNTVKGMLRPNDSQSFSDDADDRLAALQSAVSLQLEQKIGRVFGGVAVATARTVDGRYGSTDEVLELPYPVLSIDSIAVIGDVPETLEATDWTLWYPSRIGDYYGVKGLLGRVWPVRDGTNRVTVTAVWADQWPNVEDDLTYAANYLIAELFKAETASPAGFTGPDGSTVPVRNPWKHEMVTAVIAKYKVDTTFLAF